MNEREFTEFIWQQSKQLYRDMPWRDNPSFYNVLVSEIMLQQTQVARALVKYDEFMQSFPDVSQLAAAPLSDVLRAWQGLGYNRRAKYLHEAAKMVSKGGAPTTKAGCTALPAIGDNTAGAIMAYVYNQPELFIETNIRTVYIYHFFSSQIDVTDVQIRMKLAATIDQEHPRQFYWGLMDYGSALKASGVRNTGASKHYAKQSPLKGSVREVRGEILRTLTDREIPLEELARKHEVDERLKLAVDGLLRDGLVERHENYLRLTKY